MDMDNTVLHIGKDKLFELLKTAYEEGSRGYLDLRDAVASRITEEYLLESKSRPPDGKFESYPFELQRSGIQLVSATHTSTGIQVGVASTIS